MGVVTRAKKRRLELEEEEQRHLTDWISRLPDDALGDIVSLLPTKAGARTQVLSSRWRHIWRRAPLNLDGSLADSVIRRILSSHPGPSRRFSYSYGYCNSIANLDDQEWLRSPAMDKLQELELYQIIVRLPESVHRFSSTLRVATFRRCCFGESGNDAGAAALHLPLLKQLSLVEIRISESCLRTLLAGCPALQSLLLCYNHTTGLPAAQIVSPSLVSIGVHPGSGNLKSQQLIVKDAPCLERLLLFGGSNELDVLVISAPRLHTLGKLGDNYFPRFHYGTTLVQASNIASMTTVVSSVKVLALSDVNLCPNVVINIIKCFPQMEKLYIQIQSVGVENWSRYRKSIGNLNIRLRKIVLANYLVGYRPHVKLAKFFLSNARVLELMRFEIPSGYVLDDEWIEEERSLLQIENRVSMAAQFEFVSENNSIGTCSQYDEVHDLSIPDPFQRIRVDQ